MPITVACPSCRKALKAPDNAVGRKVKCPGCGTALTIPIPQNAPAPFESLPVPTPATPNPRAKTPNRTILFAAVGGGVLVFLLLAVVLVVVLKSGDSQSSVKVSVNWKTPNGVEFDDNPVAVLIPKGMKEKIDQFAPIYAGEDYEKAFSKDFRKCGAYLAVGFGGKAWFKNIPHGSYTLVIFPNSFFREMDEGIREDEARRAEQQLQPFFTRVQLDNLRKKPVLVREIEVKDRVVDVRHEFPKRGEGRQAKVEPKALPEPKVQPEPKAKEIVKEDPAERTAEEEVKKAEATKINPSDLAASNANLKFGGKVVEITAVVKGVRKGRYDQKTGERLIIDLEYDKKPEFDHGPVACRSPSDTRTSRQRSGPARPSRSAAGATPPCPTSYGTAPW